MSPEEIARLRARVNAATPGPWKREVSAPGFAVRGPRAIGFDMTVEDAGFIAEARADVPVLLGALEAERARTAALLDRCAALELALLETEGKRAAAESERMAAMGDAVRERIRAEKAEAEVARLGDVIASENV